MISSPQIAEVAAGILIRVGLLIEYKTIPVSPLGIHIIVGVDLGFPVQSLLLSVNAAAIYCSRYRSVVASSTIVLVETVTASQARIPNGLKSNLLLGWTRILTHHVGILRYNGHGTNVRTFRKQGQSRDPQLSGRRQNGGFHVR